MGALRAVLAGTGVAIPPNEVDNHQLTRILDTSDEWIRERSGIVTRRYVDPGTSSADLGAEAGGAALENAGVGVSEVDYLVCATMTPDHYFPGVGTLIQHRLGLRPVPALDLRQQCAGFAYALSVTDALIRSGQARTVLVIGTDVHTSLLPYDDHTWRVFNGEEEGPLDEERLAWNNRFRHLIVLFGDGAGAMVFTAEEDSDRGILGSRLHGDGAEKEILYVDGLGSVDRPYASVDRLLAGDYVPKMDGRSVFRLAVTRMPEATREVLADHGYGVDDVDLLVMHQANYRINAVAQKNLGLPDERVHNNIHKYGNTTSATLPLCFHEARQEGKAPEGALVAFAVLGAGLHWGAVLLRV